MKANEWRAIRWQRMVGHPGAAPGVSPIRTARIAVFLMPEERDISKEWSHGESHPGLRHAMASSYY